MPHDFETSLALSQQYENAPWWLDVYRQAFPNLEAAVSVRSDGWAQRAGIDRVLTLSSGKTLAIDEKIRTKDYGDILLEYWSDRDRKVPGWVAKDLATDFIAYAFVPSQTCYLLPFPTLRRAWQINRKLWVERFKKTEANNGRYMTVGVAVPIKVLLTAMVEQAMVVKW